METQIAREDHALARSIMDLGPVSPYSCPECQGVLVQLQDGDFVRLRCHMGHAYSLSTLLTAVTESLENSLWSTLRVIDERVLLLRHLANMPVTGRTSGWLRWPSVKRTTPGSRPSSSANS